MEPDEYAKRRTHSAKKNQRIPGLSPQLLTDHELPHTLLSAANCRTGVKLNADLFLNVRGDGGCLKVDLLGKAASRCTETSEGSSRSATSTPHTPTGCPTYDIGSTCRYPGDTGRLVRIARRLTFWARSKRKINEKAKKSQLRVRSPMRHLYLFPHLGNKIWHGEIWNKEADRRNAPKSCGFESSSNTTGKVTGHFHLAQLINPLLSAAVNNSQLSHAIKGEEKKKKLHSVLITPQCLFTATGRAKRFGLFITVMLKTDASLRYALAEVCQSSHPSAALRSRSVELFFGVETVFYGNLSTGLWYRPKCHRHDVNSRSPLRNHDCWRSRNVLEVWIISHATCHLLYINDMSSEDPPLLWPISLSVTGIHASTATL